MAMMPLKFSTKLFALEDTLKQQEQANQLAQELESGLNKAESKQTLDEKLSVRGLQNADVLAPS